MIKPLTVTELKKELNKLDQKQLADMIADLYKKDEKVKDILCVRLMGEAYKNALLEKYKTKMHDLFFPRFNLTMPALKSAKALITEIKKIGDDEMSLELMLYYVECGNEFTNAYGDIDDPFYSSLTGMYAQFVKQLNIKGTESTYLKYQERINDLVASSAHIGWGYGDYLLEKSFEIEWFGEE
ncbi:hypothetical protein GH808_13310 [Acetobacterium fimetarium]|uniref:Uncharacterized protein n=1 Tax=Acetobacterium fimetarium TaxID=52691 RepID=A0ABR6WYQ9_9FIRM|nr:DUF6155 family protein [Acetobacterium fimetarium]MBC3805396.1 hypothetical protein [Acetobacterium fimetarium]